MVTDMGIVPPDDFALRPGDKGELSVGELTLENEVAPSCRISTTPTRMAGSGGGSPVWLGKRS